MRYFITGGTGFLGSTLAKRLIKENNEVIIYGRNILKGKELEKDGIIFIEGDLIQKEKIVTICKNVDYIFHSGAFSSPWGKYQDFHNSNVLGTQNIVDAALKNNVKRLIHVSTPSIYFDFKDKFNISETDQLPQKFVNHYAHTKYDAEKIIDNAVINGLEAITIRPKAIFGIGDTAILPRIIIANQRGIPLINGGNALIDISYVENVVDSMLLCRDANTICIGQKYNITNGEPMKLIDIIEEVFRELNVPLNAKNVNYNVALGFAGLMEIGYKIFLPSKEPPIMRYSIGVFGNSQTLSIEKAKQELGYMPQVSIKEGIKTFAQWWKNESN